MLGRERWPTTTSTLPAGAPDTPRSPIALARSVALWWLCGLYALWGFAYIVFVTFFGAAATASGLPAERVGQVWTLLGAFAGISGLVWGWASDRLGRMPALALVFVCQGVASAALQRATTMEWFIAAAVLFGIGGWGAVAIISAAGPEVAGAPLAPAALGLLTLAFGMGQACGPLIAGLLNDATGNLAASLLLAAAVLFAAAGLALGGRYVRRLDVS
jgi:predicted MFS family arabinose efflux permease